MQEKPILEVQHLKLELPQNKGWFKAVNDVSFSLYPGKTLALVGESGSGKSLTALSILRLLPLKARCGKKSKILFHDQDLLALTEHELQGIRGKKIGMIFQEPMTALNPVLTIGYQLSETLWKHLQLSHHQIHSRSLELLEQVGLMNAKALLHAYPHELSGGQRQRVAIAIALAGEPDILIADEPTTALDVTIQAQILDLLLITHDLSVVAKLADDVCVMYSGKIVEHAPVETLFEDPKDPYTQALFKAFLIKRDPKTRSHKKEEKPLLVLKDVHVNFKRKNHWWEFHGTLAAVDGVSFSLYPGKTLALVGESGSGKTTLAKALLRLVHMSGGEITLHTDALYHSMRSLSMREQAKWMQIIWQDPYSSLDPRQSIRNILAEGLEVNGKSAISDSVMIDLLNRVGLPAASMSRYPHQFSGGQRQRIAIARALAAKPKILICDEPTSALDVSVQAQVLNLLQELQAQSQLAYLLITHNMSVVEYLADTVAVMYMGRIVEFGDVEQVLHKPKHPYTKLLLKSVLSNKPGKRKVK
jgi:peptide/nickel transport system ATP-binding protein